MKLIWRFLPSDLDRSKFDCGTDQLNDYFRRYAGQNHRSRLAVCTVALTEDQSTVVGYYTLSAGEVARASFPPNVLKGLPRYPVPVIRIGQLAVDSNFQGQGAGKLVLAHALRTVLHTPAYGAVAVAVDSLSARATEFYRRHGFSSIADDKPNTLVIAIKTIERAFSEE